MKKSNVIALLGMACLIGVGYLMGVKKSVLVLREKGSSPKDIEVSSLVEESNSFEMGSSSEQSIISLFEKISPSVVFINTSTLRRDWYSRSMMETPLGSGSGFVWDRKGHIVTNYHVVEGAKKYEVTFSDGEVYEAELVGRAPDKDLAVLRLIDPSADLLPIPVGTSGDLRVGQTALAIGNPFGLDHSLTTGIVSALGREIESNSGVVIKDVIQTDAAINPGNSGGPLLDSSGRLIGVNTAIYSPSGAYAGIGFSIPVDVVNWIVPELIQYGRLQRPTLGISIFEENLAKRYGFTGIMIRSVEEGGAADLAGLRPPYRDRNGSIAFGDIISALNGEPIRNRSDLILALEKYEVGEEVELTVERDREKIRVPVVLGESYQ